MNLYRELPAGAQAAYSEAYEAAQHADLHRSIASLNGSFQSKQIRGKTYWYYAFRQALDGKVRQIYVGPDSPKTEALKEKAKHAPKENLRRQAGAAIAHGCATLIPKHFRIIRQLSDARFFRAGGILVGSHAFLAMGNMLGVRWEQATHTLDIDFAHAGQKGSIAVALPADIDVDVQSAIDSLEMGFLPSLSFSGGSSGSYVSEKEPDLRLDFLTPMRRDENTIEVPSLNISLVPLKFLDYLIEKPAQAALLSSQGALVVSIPDPARFALHKLLVAGKRPIRERAKAAKDITQAASIISFMQDHMPPDVLQEAWEDLESRGPGWRSRFHSSLERLKAGYPEIGERFVAETMDKASRPLP